MSRPDIFKDKDNLVHFNMRKRWVRFRPLRHRFAESLAQREKGYADRAEYYERTNYPHPPKQPRVCPEIKFKYAHDPFLDVILPVRRIGAAPVTTVFLALVNGRAKSRCDRNRLLGA
jgi:hypothetical protein